MITDEMIDAGVKAAAKYWQRYSKEREMCAAIYAAMKELDPDTRAADALERAERIRENYRDMHGIDQ